MAAQSSDMFGSEVLLDYLFERILRFSSVHLDHLTILILCAVVHSLEVDFRP